MADLIWREDLDQTDLCGVDSGQTISPVTPGEVLRLEFMELAGLSAYALAKATGVPTNRITAILHGTRGITADTALRLARHFGTSAEMWMNLQTAYDLERPRGRMAA
jgi:addiction module HigA family antidote